MTMAAPPKITSRWGERIKHALVPDRLYIRYRAAKERRRGEAEARLLPFLVDPARNAIDAGANKGTYTYLMARTARHVHAFEPNPKMFALLQRTAPRNATAHPIALADGSGTAVLRIPYGRKGHSNQGASLSAAKVGGDFTPVTVETRRIDDLALGEIGFIKIDVEGFEAAVLAGAAATIMRDRPSLLIEIEERHTRVPIEESLAHPLALGYDGFFLRNGMLRPLSDFDPETDHRHPAAGYVFNFVFLPRGPRL